MNVPNFVDLESGGYGVMIQDGLNSTQTPTMANISHSGNYGGVWRAAGA
jgi:hypothetical protein